MNNLKDLFVLSITNMLERFGFYVMMSILVISFMEQRGLSSLESGYYYSFFYASIYLSMVLMGVIGDFINRRKVVLGSIILMALGYLLYALLSKESAISLIIPGTFIILGTGAFKTNLLVQVGDLYRNNLKNGSLAYLIFFSFINLGAIFAPFASKSLKEIFGMNSVFVLSAGATLLAFILYYFGSNSTKTKYKETINTENITHTQDSNNIISESKKYGLDRLIGLIFLILLVPVFWMAYHQQGYVYTYYLRDLVDLNGIPSETFLSSNPIALILFSCIGIVVVYFLVKIKNIHSIFPIIGIGMLLAAIGYYIPAYGLAHISGKLPITYAFIPVLIITLGEFLISPFLVLGFYHFSPAKVRGLFIGLYMAVAAIGNSLLFKYGIVYQKHGAAYTFNKIVIHILICTAAVFLIWFLIKKLSVSSKNKKF